MSELTATNRQSLRSFLQKKQCPLDVHAIPGHKAGGGVFTCGDTKGWISKNALESIQSGFVDPDYYEYAEVSKPGSTEAVPCLMVKSTSNLVHTFQL